jgi:hypothetical protein
MRAFASIALLTLSATAVANTAGRTVVSFPQLGIEVVGGPGVTDRKTRAALPREEKRFARIAAKLNPRGRIERVLYPAGGADAWSVFRAFAGPNGGPSEVMILDRWSFGRPAEIAATFPSAELKTRYFSYLAVGHGSVTQNHGARFATSLLWELERLGVTKVKVEYLDPRGRSIPAKIIPDLWTTDDPKEIQAALRFQFELDGKERTVTLVDHDLSSRRLPPLAKQFVRAGVDAIFDKGDLGTWKGSVSADFIQWILPARQPTAAAQRAGLSTTSTRGGDAVTLPMVPRGGPWHAREDAKLTFVVVQPSGAGHPTWADGLHLDTDRPLAPSVAVR